MEQQYLYIMVDPDKPNKCKVGRSKDPDKRIKAYRTANPSCYMFFKTKIENKLVEKRIIEELKSGFKVQSEYVHCHPQIVRNIIEGFLEEE